MLKAALWYIKNGYAIIPVQEKGGDGYEKKPYIKWAEYQKRKPTEEEVREWWAKWPKAMVGVLTGVINGLSVVDFDSHKLNDMQFEEYMSLFPGFPKGINTPTATTPHEGYHFYFKYHAEIPQGQAVYSNVDCRNNGGYIIAPPSSMNGSGKYEWVEGKKITDINLATIPVGWLDVFKNNSNTNYINSFYRGGVVNSDKPQTTTMTTSNHNYFMEGRRDDDLFHTANCLIKGGADSNFAMQVLERITQTLGSGFSGKEAHDKLLSAIRRAGNRERNISHDVEEWTLTTTGHFLTTDCHKELNLTTSDHKKAANMALLRLVDKGIIEKHGEKRGSYRLKEVTLYEDWQNAEIDSLDIALPFNLETYVEIYPGDVIVIAGVKNAGKTAIALETIRLNMGNFDCYYHSSELVKQTFRLRVSKCEHTRLEHWKSVKMSQGLCMSNAGDRVVKDALNVFDYIEGDEGEFYKIPSTIAKIHRALGNGVGVVCLQKPSTRAVARGGEGTKDKASLYLTLDKQFPFHIIRVEECKTFREFGDIPVNPTGFALKYKVKNGVNLYPDDTWRPEEDERYGGFDK